MISNQCRRILLAATVLCSAATANAQKTDFSGTWQFRDQESISGNLYSNGMPKQIQAAQKKDHIVIIATSDDGTGKEYTVTDTLSFSGKAFETRTATSKRKKVVEITWSGDSKDFTSTTNLFNKDEPSKKDFTTIDKWEMNEDGTLSLTRKTENFSNGEKWEAKAIYEKQ